MQKISGLIIAITPDILALYSKKYTIDLILSIILFAILFF